MTGDPFDDDLPPSPRDEATRTRLDHDAYLKAVNNPTRRRLLEIVSKNELGKDVAAQQLVQEGLLHEPGQLQYHLDVLLKAKCIELVPGQAGQVLIRITQGGRVVEYMEK
ncbi:MAG: hypothetical protein GYA24_12825 [Candidatus Lokiarchaeota archaeon]|nr:hypothetical protein [Candidatus Lokiarchaeota archaeon]